MSILVFYINWEYEHIKLYYDKKITGIYKILYERTGEAPMWNFYKFVVAPDAKKINVFPSTVSPESSEFLDTLKPYLNN